MCVNTHVYIHIYIYKPVCMHIILTCTIFIVTISKQDQFLRRVFSTSPHLKLEDHLLSAVRDRLVNIFADILRIGGRPSIRHPRTRYAVVKGTQRSHHMWHYFTYRRQYPTPPTELSSMSYHNPSLKIPTLFITENL